MSTVRLLVLGVIRRQGQTHGYRVHRELSSWKIETWTSVKAGSVYHALKQLEKQHMLRNVNVENSEEGPARTLYELSTEGEVEFIQLLKKALTSMDMEFFGAGIAFMQVLPRSETVSLLRIRAQQSDEIHAGLKAMLPLYQPANDSPNHQELLGMWMAFFLSTSNWTSGLVERLEGICGKECNDSELQT
ncbi:PadR family transcriptional regulator [Paenibacillus sp. J23TS9]|uniref:PadR family transcriptional regulator n=1 Tax=Paenibacillus sp. J23TS9 TaxID=2807193 RepID=UPI001B1D69C5|nr:PadR family transcriptional regulator [Paenibacillus sp. J23TS9]GIP26256.1 PadR family transcriptional regulator [Paenibacillus sp. J23TS9]